MGEALGGYPFLLLLFTVTPEQAGVHHPDAGAAHKWAPAGAGGDKKNGGSVCLRAGLSSSFLRNEGTREMLRNGRNLRLEEIARQ